MPKISLLPGAPITPLQPADLIVCVQGGVTCQATVADLPGGGGSWTTVVTPGGGQLTMRNVSGSAHIVLADSGQIDYIMDADSQIVQDVAAAEQLGIHFGAASSLQMLLRAQNPNSIRLELIGFGFLEMGVGGINNLNIQGWGSITMQYTVGNPANWAGPGSPTDVWVALDRIAAAVAGLLGGGIP